MKQKLIIALVCLNVALIATLLISGLSPSEAKAARFPSTDYVVLTGGVGGNFVDTVFIIDVKTQKMTAFTPKESTGNRVTLVPYKGRQLTNDFQVR